MQEIKSCCQTEPPLSCSFLNLWLLCLLHLLLLRCFLTVNICVKVSLKSPQVALGQRQYLRLNHYSYTAFHKENVNFQAPSPTTYFISIKWLSVIFMKSQEVSGHWSDFQSFHDPPPLAE